MNAPGMGAPPSRWRSSVATQEEADHAAPGVGDLIGLGSDVWALASSWPSGSAGAVRDGLQGLLRLVLAVASGLLLAAAFPPHPRPGLMILGLLLGIALLRERSVTEQTGVGLMIGVAWYHGMLGALAPEWGLDRAAIIFGASAASLGAVFAASGFLSTRLPLWARPLSLAMVWPLGTWVLARLFSTPHMLAGAFAEHPAWLGAVRWVGLPLWESALLAAAGSVVALAHGRSGEGGAFARLRARPAWAVLGISLGILGLGPWVPTPTTDGAVEVAGLQSQISTREYEAARWSLFTRHRVEERLDEWTQRALQEGARVVVWPEGGNELPNRGLTRRRARMEEVTAGSTATVLVGSREVDAEGGVSNTIAAWRSGEFHEEIKKARPVPVAESSLIAGAPGVVAAEGARFGIAICFDVLFGAHTSALRDLGAEVLVVSSDDASFGDAALSDWHLAVARVRALEVGRPLVFVSNAGPSGIYDAAGEPLSELALGAEGMVRAQVPRAMRGGAPFPLLGVLMSAFGVGFTLLRRARVPNIRPSPDPRWVYALGSLGVAGWIATHGSQGGPPPVDALSPLFQQTRQESCGPAALAFALTYLGDEVTEGALGGPGATDSSLAELADRATSRGFAARGVHANAGDLESLGGAVAIAHYDVGHFVVVLNVEREAVWLFDPGYGKTLQVPRAAFEAVYSGRALILTPAAG